MDGCSSSVHGRGLCNKHYIRLRKNGCPLVTQTPARGMDIHERFNRSFIRAGDDECWLWKLKPSSDGYGKMTIKGRTVRAHRLAYELFIGHASDGLVVCHTCDVPLCVNPSHLFLGTQRDNWHDMLRKGRGVFRRGEERAEHILTEKDVMHIRASADSDADLAEKLGVSRQTVSDARTGRTWSHVGGMS